MAGEQNPHATTHYAFGDVLARITTAMKVAPCKGCKKRKEKLNKLVPRVKRKRRT